MREDLPASVGPLSTRPSALDSTISIIAPRGRLDALVTPLLESELRRLIEQGKCRLIVDFSNVVYIGSLGLKILLMALKQAKACGGDVKLIALNPRVSEVFELIGFTQLFSVYRTEADAARAFDSALEGGG